jgi:hypothetical protein
MILVVEVNPLNVGYALEKYYESPGICFPDKGMASLYNAEWKTVVYVDVKALDNNTA